MNHKQKLGYMALRASALAVVIWQCLIIAGCSHDHELLPHNHELPFHDHDHEHGIPPHDHESMVDHMPAQFVEASYEIMSPPAAHEQDVILNWTIQFDKRPIDLQVTDAFEYTEFGTELRLSTRQEAVEIVVEWEGGQKRFFNPLTLGIDPPPSSTILPEHQFSLWFWQRLQGVFYAQALNVTGVTLNGVPATKTGDRGWSLALNLPKGSHHLTARWTLSNGFKGSQTFGPYTVE